MNREKRFGRHAGLRGSEPRGYIAVCQALERRQGVLERAVEINRLENEADRAHQRAVGQLFEEEHDPLAVMKWKEILDRLEDSTDRCEEVANLLENVVVKHG